VRTADARRADAAYLAIMQRAIAIPRIDLGRLRWNQDYVDVALAIALTVLALSGTGPNHVRLDALSVPLLILQTLPVAVRRRNPMRILIVTGLAITFIACSGIRNRMANSVYSLPSIRWPPTSRAVGRR